MRDQLLEMHAIRKAYGAVLANDGIDLNVGYGQIIGLLGENGSGKSTLMKILFGTVVPDAGTIIFHQQELSNHTPADAIAAGIGMVHQHFTVIENMNVVDNVMLGWSAAGRWLDRRGVSAAVAETSARYGLDLHPAAMVRDLSLGRRQRVEILKCLMRGADLLILDEPTSNLSPPEVASLFHVLRRLRQEGKSIVFISHKLTEILDLCDNVVVLRDGRVVGRSECAGATRADLARAMVGRDTTEPLVRSGQPLGPILLNMQNVSVPAADDGPGIDCVNLSLRGGEILSIVGVDGNGQTELAEVIAGIRKSRSGSILLSGSDITQAAIASRVSAGLSYIPADRIHTSLVGRFSVADNLALRDVSRPHFSTRGWLRRARGWRHAQRLVERYAIRTPAVSAAAASLSGGNQQKIVVAREIDRQPKVVVAHQATWGLDPGATRFVLETLLALSKAGAAVLYITAELEEGLAIGDRIGVMYAGRLVGVVERADANPQTLGLMMAGAEAA